MNAPFPKAVLPSHLQSGISASTYAALSQTPWCARLNSPCTSVCQPLNEDGTYNVEVDHIKALSCGGSNGIDNVRWLCADKNREKYNKPDPLWSGSLYFDQRIDEKKLRPHQFAKGYALAAGGYARLFKNPGRLLSKFMVLAWMVGAGKTVGMLSILFGINQARKQLGAVRRNRRVLWLVHQKTLVKSLADEIRKELVEYKIVDNAPSVVEVTDSKKWAWSADVVVACPQALWDHNWREDEMTEDDRAKVLANFDTIIIDEAQFGIDKYLSIARCAPHAFKFAVTATPMNSDGELFCDMDQGSYRNNFVLFSQFSYQDGREGATRIYKDLLPFDQGEDKCYIAVKGGEAEINKGERTEGASSTTLPSLSRDIAIIKRAIGLASALDLEYGYANHIMARCKSINEAKALYESFADIGSVVYAGSGTPTLGDNRHAWMLVKNYKGKLGKGAKRLVITVDIGQFGINNRYCTIVAWVNGSYSMIEIVQRIGRAIRATGVTGEKVHLLWNGDDLDFEDALKGALEFILHYDMSAFPTMDQLSGEQEETDPIPPKKRILEEDAVALIDLFGSYVKEGHSVDESKAKARDEFVASLQAPSEDYLSKIDAYMEDVNIDDVVNKQFNYPKCIAPQEIVTKELHSDDELSEKRLIAMLERGEVMPDLTKEERSQIISDLPTNATLAIVVRASAQSYHEETRRLESISTLNPEKIVYASKKEAAAIGLPFPSYLNLLMIRFSKVKGVDPRTLGGKVNHALRIATPKKFGFPNGSVDYWKSRGLEKPYAYALTKPEIRNAILHHASLIMIEKDPSLAPGLHHLHTMGNVGNLLGYDNSEAQNGE